MATVAILRRLALLLGLISACVSCSTNSTNPGLRFKLPGTPAAQQRTITLQRYFEFNPLWYSQRYRLPEGEYRATFEDEHGIYFPAPAKIKQVYIVGSYDFEGGLYWAKLPNPRLRFYRSMNLAGGPPWKTYDLPPEFTSAEGTMFRVEPPLPR